jgi:methylenetetrahydrofolate reductase (NADPH)
MAVPADTAASRDTAAPGAPAASPDVTALAAEMVACGSLEMGADAPDDACRIAELLPAGTPVYVNHLPRHPLEHGLKALVALSELNLEPVPHMAARRIGSRAEVRSFLSRAVRLAGVRKALLIGGDVADPLGPYADAAALLGEDVFAEHGLAQVGFAGYPEGHPRIASGRLAAALDGKLALARAKGLEPYVVTQFCFAPNRITEYCAELARRAPGVAVYVGLAGPTTPVSLLRFAQRCGVGASLRALQAEGMRAVRLVTHVDPADQLMGLAQHLRSGGAGNVVGVHLYSFGGVARTAAWMNARITQRA